MKIKEVADQTNLPISTIRYYEKRKLIPDAYLTRDKNNYRDFSPEVVEHLKRITRLLSAGFSINELFQIREEFGSELDIRVSINLLKKKLLEIEKKEIELKKTRELVQKMLKNKEKKLARGERYEWSNT